MTRAMVDSGERDRRNSRDACVETGEKSLEVYMRCPYRKPTQVGRKRILRPTGEGLSRNSAK